MTLNEILIPRFNKAKNNMRAIDNYTDKEREVLELKGMTAPRTASELPVWQNIGKSNNGYFLWKSYDETGKPIYKYERTQPNPYEGGYYSAESAAKLKNLQPQGNKAQHSEIPGYPNKEKSSPLPWRTLENYKGGIPLSIQSDENTTVASVDWLPDGSGRASEKCEANAKLIVASVNGYGKAIQALRDLTAEIKLGTLNVRKDFSLMVAHAAATKVLHEYEAAQ